MDDITLAKRLFCATILPLLQELHRKSFLSPLFLLPVSWPPVNMMIVLEFHSEACDYHFESNLVGGTLNLVVLMCITL